MGQWWAIVPFRADAAKSRLSSFPAAQRAELARSFARDTATAALACPEVAGVLVVGDDTGLEGIDTVADPGGGLNAALSWAALRIPPGHGAVALMADLPALRTDELTRALRAAADHGRSFVCDAEGTGTTMLASRTPHDLGPRFGLRSRAAHAASGARELEIADAPGLRRDVDDAVALWDAVRLGVGTDTRRALEA